MLIDFMPYDFCKMNCPLQVLIIETDVCEYVNDPSKIYKNTLECANRRECRAFLALEKGSEE